MALSHGLKSILSILMKELAQPSKKEGESVLIEREILRQLDINGGYDAGLTPNSVNDIKAGSELGDLSYFAKLHRR